MKTRYGKLRSPLKYHGGKSYLARRIIKLMPPRQSVYIEPYFGGGSVLLNRTESTEEIAGDTNVGLMNFWRYLRASDSPLIDMIKAVDYDENRFLKAKQAVREGRANVGVDAALEFLIANRMSRGGLGKDFAWSERLRGYSQPGGPVPGDLNAWRTFKLQLKDVAERIHDVRFVVQEALDLIRLYNDKHVLFYLDPPYLIETRSFKKAYGENEVEAEDVDESGEANYHERLLRIVNASQAKIMLSGYPSTLYSTELSDWRLVQFDMPNHSGQGETKQRRIECVWMNF